MIKRIFLCVLLVCAVLFAEKLHFKNAYFENGIYYVKYTHELYNGRLIGYNSNNQRTTIHVIDGVEANRVTQQIGERFFDFGIKLNAGKHSFGVGSSFGYGKFIGNNFAIQHTISIAFGKGNELKESHELNIKLDRRSVTSLDNHISIGRKHVMADLGMLVDIWSKSSATSSESNEDVSVSSQVLTGSSIGIKIIVYPKNQRMTVASGCRFIGGGASFYANIAVGFGKK